MIYILGDSHSRQFNKMTIPFVGLEPTITLTMHRVGRDKSIYSFNDSLNSESNVFILSYGEIDVRCHIKLQIEKGRNLEEIIETLTENYLSAVKSIIKKYKAIIICSVTPPLSVVRYDMIHNNSKTINFPFNGTDEERVTYYRLINNSLEKKCKEYGFHFLFFSPHYEQEDGMLDLYKSDRNVHISQDKAGYIHKMLEDYLKEIGYVV